MTEQELKDAHLKYVWQRNNAKRRNIPFPITFDEWMTIWLDSGHWHQRGIKSADDYVMSRIGDTGPYSADNVIIKTNRDNVLEGTKGIKKPPGHGANVSRAQKGISKPGPVNGYPKISCITCKKVTGINCFHTHYNSCIKKAPRRVLS